MCTIPPFHIRLDNSVTIQIPTDMYRPSQHSMSSHHGPASKMPFEWHFTGGSIVARWGCSMSSDTCVRCFSVTKVKLPWSTSQYWRLDLCSLCLAYMSRDTRFPTMWYVRPAKPQINLRSLIRAFASRLNIL